MLLLQHKITSTCQNGKLRSVNITYFSSVTLSNKGLSLKMHYYNMLFMSLRHLSLFSAMHMYIMVQCINMAIHTLCSILQESCLHEIMACRISMLCALMMASSWKRRAATTTPLPCIIYSG